MAGPINWLLEVDFPLAKFGFLSIPRRRGAVLATVVGIAGVVDRTLAGVLSISACFKQAMVASGSPDTAIVLRSGADSEVGPAASDARKPVSLPTPPAWPAPRKALLPPLNFSSSSTFPKRSTGTDANVPLRGVERAAFQVHDNFKIIRGRMFDWGGTKWLSAAAPPGNLPGWTLAPPSRSGMPKARCRDFFRQRRGGGIGDLDRRGGAPGSLPSRQQLPIRPGQTHFRRRHETASRDSLTSNPQLSVKVQRQTEYYVGAIRNDDAAGHDPGLPHRVSHGHRRGLRRLEHHVQRRLHPTRESGPCARSVSAPGRWWWR